jgi:Tol biopolymer transport system component
VFNRSGESVIGIRSNDTGATRDVHFLPALANVQALSWARDGESFLVAAHDDKSRPGVFRVTLNGDVTRLLEAQNFAWEGFFSTPDGRRMIYRMQRDGAIHEYDFASGTTRVMMPGGADDANGRLGAVSLSPDGRLIATSRVDAATDSRALLLIPYGGGAPRELMRAAQGHQLLAADWTPDGDALLVVRSSGDTAIRKELLLVPIDGATPRKLEVDVSRLAENAGRIRLHADGTHLAFVTGGQEKAIWVCRDALQVLRATP